MSYNINWINKKLAETYGQDDLKRPNFRISWSEDQFEKRWCEPMIYYGDIFIRKENKEVREMRKYPFVHNRNILERLTYHCNPELIDNPSYEAIYVFEDKNKAPLPLDWEMITYACHYIMTGQVRSKQSYEEEKLKKENEEKENLRAELKNDRPYLATMTEMGEAASIPKVDMWERYQNVGPECGSNDCKSDASGSESGETNS